MKTASTMLLAFHAAAEKVLTSTRPLQQPALVKRIVRCLERAAKR